MFFKRVKICCSIFYRLFKVLVQVIYGAWRLSTLQGPLVAIFGGARLSQESVHAQAANDLAKKLVEHDISVLTGGGPGVMYAANCGAVSKDGGKGRSVGIG
ncbi:MAG: TIGR00730 family Rossman fold protein, partial [Candidatus Marinimicrobia bacterium]|nr:TIGR00730 family Rossman fold protein [Candidatus Neomarinimicrobiota bacterium]